MSRLCSAYFGRSTPRRRDKEKRGEPDGQDKVENSNKHAADDVDQGTRTKPASQPKRKSKRSLKDLDCRFHCESGIDSFGSITSLETTHPSAETNSRRRRKISRSQTFTNSAYVAGSEVEASLKVGTFNKSYSGRAARDHRQLDDEPKLPPKSPSCYPLTVSGGPDWHDTHSLQNMYTYSPDLAQLTRASHARSSAPASSQNYGQDRARDQYPSRCVREVIAMYEGGGGGSRPIAPGGSSSSGMRHPSLQSLQVPTPPPVTAHRRAKSATPTKLAGLGMSDSREAGARTGDWASTLRRVQSVKPNTRYPSPRTLRPTQDRLVQPDRSGLQGVRSSYGYSPWRASPTSDVHGTADRVRKGSPLPDKRLSEARRPRDSVPSSIYSSMDSIPSGTSSTLPGDENTSSGNGSVSRKRRSGFGSYFPRARQRDSLVYGHIAVQLDTASTDQPANIPMLVKKDFTLSSRDEHGRFTRVSAGEMVTALFKNRHWVYVTTQGGEKGYAPLMCLKPLETTLDDIRARASFRDSAGDVAHSEYSDTVSELISDCESVLTFDYTSSNSRFSASSRVSMSSLDDRSYASTFGGSQSDLSIVSGYQLRPRNRLTVLFDYDAQSENHVTVLPGDEVSLLDANDPDWVWVRCCKDGSEGYIPKVYAADLKALNLNPDVKSTYL